MAKKTNVEPINMDFSINSLLDTAIAENNPTPDTDENETLEAADATFADEATVVTPAPAKRTRSAKAPVPTPAEPETKVTVEHDFKELINSVYVLAEAIKRLTEATISISETSTKQTPETTPALAAPPVVVKPAPVEKEAAPAPAKPAAPKNPVRAKFPDGVGYEDIANECRRIIQEDNLYGRQRVVEIIKALGVNDMKSLPVHRYEEAMTLLMATK